MSPADPQPAPGAVEAGGAPPPAARARAARVLVVDDDQAVRSALTVNLQKAGYAVATAARGEEALDAVAEEEPDVVISDVRMPGISGEDLLSRLRAGWPDLPVILMTGHGSVASAVAAMRTGAADYLIKPVRKDELLVVLERALQNRALRREVEDLRAELGGRGDFEGMVGQSSAMQRVYALVRSVAPTDALVLVTGPTGTGKELVSRALHARSSRAAGPMLALNCGALPQGLLESELFGHEKGAFTGAVRRHQGKFEQADRGTLMLDEIGEIPHSTQVLLLRVLQSGELQRVGGSDTVRVDVRVVAATNRDLREEVRLGRFREDLFYRLNVFHIDVPALRERRDDIPLLAEHFLRRYAMKHRRVVRGIHPDALVRLVAWDWPGNVRELEHTVERAVLVEPGAELSEASLPDMIRAARAPVAVLSEPTPAPVDAPAPAPRAAPSSPAPSPAQAGPLDLHAALEAYERQLLCEALDAEGGVQARAARRLGISKSNLSYRLQRLGMVRLGVRYGVAPTILSGATEAQTKAYGDGDKTVGTPSYSDKTV
ncbi:MAG: sigma-54-dependent Fis family transcriptional regulator [Deltaproteobacteria bacterium]|nr:sigma-54-dependent Fis family transcriptional regulator [Deltaproteobacteria bacterium]